MNEDGSVCISEDEIASNLRAIVEDSALQSPQWRAANAVGVCTTEERHTWAAIRRKLEENSINRQNLGMVDEALFLVCLDDVAPATASEMAENCLHGTYSIVDGMQQGTCTNRWYDMVPCCLSSTAGSARCRFLCGAINH